MKITDAEKFVRHYWNIDGSATQLDGYIDYNFLIKVGGEKCYVLKITDQKDWFAFNESQNRLLLALNRLDTEKSMFPRLVPDREGQDLILHCDSSGKEFQLRLITYLAGDALAQSTVTPALCRDLGVFLGKTDLMLQQIDEPLICARRFDWDIQHFKDNEPWIELIDGIERRRIVAYFLSQFETFVVPELGKLPRGLIHSDANEWNILVKGDRVAGLIDFGDMVFSNRVNELAIGLVYLMMLVDDPIGYGAEMVQGYNCIIPLQEKEVELLYYLIAARLCISVCHSAYNQRENPHNQYMTISAKPVWSLLERWVAINPLLVENSFREACGMDGKSKDVEELVRGRSCHLSTTFSLSYNKKPLVMSSAALQYMFDSAGNSWLDCVNNIFGVGYAHPRVVRATQQQIARLNTNTRYLYPQLNDYLKRLCDTFPPELNKVYMVNSGSAATDLALRLARTATGKKDTIVLDSAYHGNISTAIEISPYKFEKHGGVGRQPHVHKVAAPDIFKGKYRGDDAAERYCHEVEAALQQAEQYSTPVGAFISETILGCSGQIVLPQGYLRQVYRSVREAGAICIADEVQVGFGRAGSHFWAFETQGVIPDIVIIGKPMGNGHPMAAVVTTEEIAHRFEQGPEYFNSFGGNPVSCTVGNAVLEVIEEERLQENAERIGGYLMDGLRKLQEKYPLIGDVRGLGLFIGVELIEDSTVTQPATRAAEEIIERLYNDKILMSTEGPDNNVLKIKPPLIFSRDNGIVLLSALERAFEAVG